MKFLVTGALGQLGQAVTAKLAGAGHDVVAFSSKDLDITNETAVREAIRHHLPDFVVNCAAYTNVDLAESDSKQADLVNTVGPRYVAAATEECGAILIHFSTDYVFSGEAASPYLEIEETNPINVYGQTKRDGEVAVLQSCSRAYVLRTSWLYDAKNSNFLTTMIRLAVTNEFLTVVNDQIGQPTSTDEVACAVLELCALKPDFGIYNVTCGGQTSWCGFAQEIFSLINLDSSRVKPIPSSEFVRPAKRPAYSVLSNRKWIAAGLSPLAVWENALSDIKEQAFDFYTVTKNAK